MTRFPFVMVFVASSAAAEAVDPPTPDANVPLTGHVLVWADATFYVDADETGPKLTLGSIGDRKAASGRAVAFKVVGTTGAFVEVEPVDYECTPTKLTPPADVTKLRLLVKRSDLAPLVAKPFSKNYSNGTSVIAKAGLPVVPDDKGGYRVAYDTVDLVVPIPATSIGFSYAFANGIVITKWSDPLFTIAAQAPVTLGSSTFELATHLEVGGIEKRGATTGISLMSTCLQGKMNVPSDRVTQNRFGRGAFGPGGGGRGEGVGKWSIPKGTPLFSSTMKRQIGVAAESIVVPKPDKGPACVMRFVGYDELPFARGVTKPKSPTTLTFCVAADKVVADRS